MKLPLLSFRWPWTPPPPAGSIFRSVDIFPVAALILRVEVCHDS